MSADSGPCKVNGVGKLPVVLEPLIHIMHLINMKYMPLFTRQVHGQLLTALKDLKHLSKKEIQLPEQLYRQFLVPESMGKPIQFIFMLPPARFVVTAFQQ